LIVQFTAKQNRVFPSGPDGIVLDLGNLYRAALGENDIHAEAYIVVPA
jgi:hypothetical protein